MEELDENCHTRYVYNRINKHSFFKHYVAEGFCKVKNSKNPSYRVPMKVSGCVQVSLGKTFLENRPIPVLICWSSIPCVLLKELC